MANHTPSQIRRAVHFALKSLLDPEINKMQRVNVCRYFKNACAFCGAPIPQETRPPMDHLISIAEGGTNHISNRVLACSSCNDEKLDRDWIEFLKCKSNNIALFSSRKRCIEAWVQLHMPARPNISQAKRKVLEREISKVITVFDSAVHCLRQLRRNGS